MYDERPKLKHIDVSHNKIVWLEITGNHQPIL